MTSPLRHFSITKPDGTLKSADELQAEANQLVSDAQSRAAKLRTAITANVVEATSRNQATTVSVQATGALLSIRLSDRVKSMGPALIASSIMEAYQEASRQAAARTMEITGELADGRATAMMRDLLPDYAKPEEEN